MKYLALVLLMMVSTLASGATWHVAQDGSGDFEIIQDAVDAASSGDVIHIHTGRYMNITDGWDLWGNGTVLVDGHVIITKDNLTLQGDGVDATIIGPSTFPPDAGPNYAGISVTYNEATSLTVRDLAVENVRWGIVGSSPQLNVADCRFSGNIEASIRLRYADEYAEIVRCVFEGPGRGILGFDQPEIIGIRDCRFEQLHTPLLFTGPVQVTIDRCEIIDALGAIDLQQGASGQITNCDISGCSAFGISVNHGGSAEVRGCIIEGGNKALSSNGVGGIRAEECTFSDQSHYGIYINGGIENVITDCNIYNGGQWSVYCRSSGDCYADFRGNYWGTDDEAQIQAWIYDAHDDPDLDCIVDYIPFSTVVSIEQKSWSEVKGLFRE